MKRRDFIAFIGAAMACPATAFAQDLTRVYRIFWLSTRPSPILPGWVSCGVAGAGLCRGQERRTWIALCDRQSAGVARSATELKRGEVDLAVSSGPATRAMTAVADIPVLFALSGDPVELGLVQSLGQPGGNFTGSTFLSLELAGKRVELLKEVFPNLRKLAVLSNANHPGEQSEWRATKEAAEKLGIAPLYVPFAGANELDGALTLVGTRMRMRCSSSRKSSPWCTGPRLPTRHRASAAVDVRLERIPRRRRTVELWREPAGNLFLACDLRDRILRGEKPANLPVVQPRNSNWPSISGRLSSSALTWTNPPSCFAPIG